MKEYFAHIAEDGRTQNIEQHLQGTATICSAFSKEFGAEEQGKFIGLMHDIGKYSAEFQQRLFGGPKVDHATAGAIESAKAGAPWGSFCIAGHHSGLPDMGNPRLDQPGEATLCGRMKKEIPSYAENWAKKPPQVCPLQNWGESRLTDSFLVRMLYSCLVDADYLDTESFMTDGERKRGGYDCLPALLNSLDRYTAPWQPPKNDLNKLRCGILGNCMDASQGEKGLYTLTVPTGGGKTVASMAFALNHAKKHGMSHVIYVIPYTSIIEQNAAVFRKIFGEENVIEHHSGVLFEEDEKADECSLRQALATENWDAPIIVTTAVQFFESLYANRSSQCRKLHSIANSVSSYRAAMRTIR